MDHKILFVNDCSTTLLLEQMRFDGRSNYNLIFARNGSEAIQKAMSEQPSLILMDATPQNIEACREIRKIENLQRVPILLVSSAVESGSGNASGNKASSEQTSPLMWNQLIEGVNSYLATAQQPEKAIRGMISE
ncbi:MAG TPA: hypothetical protein VFR24_13195 [Candidatus Angelobacter sp.]|nr:hypothetical protein [Candidatus Angelobacter sp.]